MTSYTGKTINDALNAAATDRGVAVEEIQYTVTEEKKGVLGIGSSVTIEVTELEVPTEEEIQEELISDIENDLAETEEEFSMDAVKEFLFDYLGDFFTGIDLDTECAIEERADGFVVNLNADNNAVLIGKMGKTLAAFNTVVRAAVNARFKKRVDVLIDVNHYKEERYYKIRAMAKRTARQVQRSHVDAELDPMPNDERKVIHKALNDWHNIKTESEGEGSNRHICIKYVEDEPSQDIAA